jgi:hypothetical protein
MGFVVAEVHSRGGEGEHLGVHARRRCARWLCL